MSKAIQRPESVDSFAGAELNHRVCNSLAAISSLVQMKARRAPTADVREALLDAAARIDTVARLHRLLAQDDDETAVSLERILSDVCAAMKSITAGSDDLLVTSPIACARGLTVSSFQALRLGFLTAELISNALKYAHPTGLPTVIRIACREDGDGMVIYTFEDDGVGFPENFDPAQHPGLGMKIIRSLGAQLQGRCEWQDHGVGLRFVCRFPADAR